MSIIDKILSLPLPILNNWGYLIIFFFSTLEAFPIIGIFVTGQVIVIIGGFLAKENILEIGDVIWVSVLGAIIGDLISYYLGKKYGYNLISKYGKYVFLMKNNMRKQGN